jgi:Arc/MetJ family transcription regulator
MRTNIEIDDELMKDALEASGLPTKRAAVEEALRLLIRISAGKQLLDMAGKVEFFDDYDPLDDADPEQPEW